MTDRISVPGSLLDGLLAATRLAAGDGPSGAFADAVAGLAARALGCRGAVVWLRRRAWDDLVVAAAYGPADVTARLADGGGGGGLEADVGGGGDDRQGRLAVVAPADGRPLTEVDRSGLEAVAAQLGQGLAARAAAAEERRTAGVLARLPDLAADGRRGVGPVCDAIREPLGFRQAEIAFAEHGRLRTEAVIGGRRGLHGMTVAELEALLAESEEVEGCRLVAPAAAPPAWGPARRRGRGPGGWPGHSLLVALPGPDGEVAGALRAASPADRERPPAGRLRLLRALAAQAATIAGSSATSVLRRSEARKAAMLASSLDGVVTIDEDGAVVEFSASAERMFGRPATEIVGRGATELVPPEGRPALRAVLRALAEGDGWANGQRTEILGLRADGTRFPCELSLAPIAAGGALLYTAFMRDITELVEGRWAMREERDRALHAARTDPLTGLPNRTNAEEHLRSAARRRGRVLALRLGLEDFGSINASLGYAQGDELLRRIAGRLTTGMPETFVARLDGDEFLVVARDWEEETALAERLHELVSTPFDLDGAVVCAAARVGLATADGPDAPELLRRSDLALRRAKALAASTVAFRADHDDAAQRVSLGRDLRLALIRGELRLHYQPVERLRDGSLRGHEALVRWAHPTRGLLTPGEFIPFAESSGLIEPIGAWVIDEACRQLAEWRGAGLRGIVSVNVSPRQVRHTDLPALAAASLERHGVPGESLLVELTETALRTGVDSVRELLARLRSLGVRSAIDDFGSDYSSLSRLRDLPVEVVKIDRSFLRGVPGDGRAEELLGAITALARALGLATIVEGVETTVQRSFATDLGCDLAQGYLLGRPAPPAEIAARAGAGAVA